MGVAVSASPNKIDEAKRLAAEQRQAAKRKVIAVWTVAAILAVAVFAAVVAYIVRQDDISTVSGEGQLTPAIADEFDGIGVGPEGIAGEGLGKGKVRFDLYLDPMCPACKSFEHYEADIIDALREDGTIDVYYHPMNGLDRLSLGTKYSSRAASAIVLIAEEDPEHMLAFIDALYANQPDENTKGLDDATLQQLATSVGVPEAVAAKIPDHAYMDWVDDASARAGERGLRVYPTFAVDGVMQDTAVNPDAIDWTLSETALHDALVKLAESKS